ncbi:hypothetical protein [Fusobacterium nucleatum]|uniref:Uncharacterized protein n=1 Tax=Fusobacterium nucleatum TaxID=851 RepID=A0A133PB65_FUSNU|nr:hypothetical protein [Fusobacterium nucleatum]KXA25762.1 hypothetical protein HMPREF3221_00263 [Fusobacterium nucleatum]MCL4575387.1 hypothetical protein [Fusobacterium nucleatum YWH7056]MCL4583089.1 hypothetical protein [Fusobacterium nucleatum YWH7054]MCL4593080.1 hypothetical protein [Fusobacterium nucleatum YWH7053]
MNEKFEKSAPNKEELERYSKIYNKGKKYFLSKNDLKKAYRMDELYLQLPSNIREKLPKIQVDINKHNEDAKTIGKNQYEKAKSMKENTFRERVTKYIEYSKVLCYDKSIRDTILTDRKKIEDKIEKTMDYKIVGGNDELLNSKIAENYRGYIEYNSFINTKDNPDTILEITTKLIEYTPDKIKEKKYMNDFDEIYTDENGKEVTNTVKYLKRHFFKTSNMKVEVKYKLTSTLTGEVILQGSKALDYEEYTYWDTYTVISGTLKDRSQFYQDGKEETLSDKERFFREMAIKILRVINQELKKLQDYDFLKIYIS